MKITENIAFSDRHRRFTKARAGFAILKLLERKISGASYTETGCEDKEEKDMWKKKAFKMIAAAALAFSFIVTAPLGLTQNMPQIMTQAYAYCGTYTVSVQSGYLALRTAKAYDWRNEIGALYSGQTVDLIDASDPTYWWVYAPSLGKYGYVNCNYLIGGYYAGYNAGYDVGNCGGYNGNYYYTYSTSFTRTVYVQSGYLALRTAKAYDWRNEIGALYSGQTVDVIDTSGGTYWWVYAPSLGSYGYVNSNYLY